MLRLSLAGFQRFDQARSFDLAYGGSEANVAASLVHFGLPVEFVLRHPDNDIGEACLGYLRQVGIGTRHIVRGGNRLGIYHLEMGSAQRASKAVYGRAGSCLAAIDSGMIDWRTALADAAWFHWMGITPAISEGVATVCMEAVPTAKRMDLTVSCDLNYRETL
jgi:2-dehydro-3-deoxygluconokinase